MVPKTSAASLNSSLTLDVEPGYYADGQFGIRIENIVIVKPVQTPNNFGDKKFMGFEHVTMVRYSWSNLVKDYNNADTLVSDPSEIGWC